MSEMGHRCSDLMEKASFESNLDQTRSRETLDRRHLLSAWATGRRDLDMGRLMTRDRKRQVDAASSFKVPRDQGKIDFLDSMLSERAAETLPMQLVLREKERPRRIDIETMDHSRTQPPFADPHYFFVTPNDRIQDGVLLIWPEWMDALASRFVDHDPSHTFVHDR
jgi:hypothetical protein